jgi:hypothetical protein
MADDLHWISIDAPERLVSMLQPAEEVELLLRDEATRWQVLGLSFHGHPVPDTEEQRVWFEDAARTAGPGTPDRPGSRLDAR